MKTIQEILGPSFYPHECGGMIECDTRQEVLKAMEEYGKLMYNQAIDDVEKLHEDYFCYEEDFYDRIRVPKLKKI